MGRNRTKNETEHQVEVENSAATTSSPIVDPGPSDRTFDPRVDVAQPGADQAVETESAIDPETGDLRLKGVRYLKGDDDGKDPNEPLPYFFQLRKIDHLSWECLAVEVEVDKDGNPQVVGAHVVRKPNTRQYVKAYLLDAALKQIDGKYKP